jgi:hypothetical protein
MSTSTAFALFCIVSIGGAVILAFALVGILTLAERIIR